MMIALRLAVVALAIAVVWFVVRFLATRERRYLRLAGRTLAIGLAAALLFFAVLIVERL